MNRLLKAAAALLCAFGLSIPFAASSDAQMTNVTAAASSLKMNGAVISTGTVAFTAVDLNGTPIAFVTGGGGLNSPGAFTCAISAGALSGCSVPDAALASPPNFHYLVQISDTSVGNPTSGKQFSLQGVAGITGTTWALDHYGPPAQTTNIASIQASGGPSNPTGSCAGPAIYTNTTTGAAFDCANGVWVALATGGSGSGITALTGDCAASGTGSAAITCTKTGGVSFGTAAITNSSAYDAAGAAAAAQSAAITASDTAGAAAAVQAAFTNTQTAGAGGVTAHTFVMPDASSPTRYITATAGTAGSGPAYTTAAAGATFRLQDPLATWQVLADGAIAAGDIVVGSTTTPGYAHDSGFTSSASVSGQTRVAGVATVATTAAGQLVTINPEGRGVRGALVDTLNGTTVSKTSVLPQKLDGAGHLADATGFGASGSGHAAGVVPDPGAVAGTNHYLREDGTWVVPAGGASPDNTSGLLQTYNTSSPTAPLGRSPSLLYTMFTSTAPMVGQSFGDSVFAAVGIEGSVLANAMGDQTLQQFGVAEANISHYAVSGAGINKIATQFFNNGVFTANTVSAVDGLENNTCFQSEAGGWQSCYHILLAEYIHGTTLDPITRTATFTATVSGTTMTVSAVASGYIFPGDYLTNSGITVGTQGVVQIQSQTSGVAGGTGVYAINTTFTPSGTITATGNADQSGFPAKIYANSPLVAQTSGTFTASVEFPNQGIQCTAVAGCTVDVYDIPGQDIYPIFEVVNSSYTATTGYPIGFNPTIAVADTGSAVTVPGHWTNNVFLQAYSTESDSFTYAPYALHLKIQPDTQNGGNGAGYGAAKHHLTITFPQYVTLIEVVGNSGVKQQTGPYLFVQGQGTWFNNNNEEVVASNNSAMHEAALEASQGGNEVWFSGNENTWDGHNAPGVVFTTSGTNGFTANNLPDVNIVAGTGTGAGGNGYAVGSLNFAGINAGGGGICNGTGGTVTVIGRTSGTAATFTPVCSGGTLTSLTPGATPNGTGYSGVQMFNTAYGHPNNYAAWLAAYNAVAKATPLNHPRQMDAGLSLNNPANLHQVNVFTSTPGANIMPYVKYNQITLNANTTFSIDPGAPGSSTILQICNKNAQTYTSTFPANIIYKGSASYSYTPANSQSSGACDMWRLDYNSILSGVGGKLWYASLLSSTATLPTPVHLAGVNLAGQTAKTLATVLTLTSDFNKLQTYPVYNINCAANVSATASGILTYVLNYSDAFGTARTYTSPQLTLATTGAVPTWAAISLEVGDATLLSVTPTLVSGSATGNFECTANRVYPLD